LTFTTQPVSRSMAAIRRSRNGRTSGRTTSQGQTKVFGRPEGAHFEGRVGAWRGRTSAQAWISAALHFHILIYCRILRDQRPNSGAYVCIDEVVQLKLCAGFEDFECNDRNRHRALQVAYANDIFFSVIISKGFVYFSARADMERN
jgi:hypothetical protein